MLCMNKAMPAVDIMITKPKLEEVDGGAKWLSCHMKRFSESLAHWVT